MLPWIPAYAGHERMKLKLRTFPPLVLAEAGNQRVACQGLRMLPWIPAFAGMTG